MEMNPPDENRRNLHGRPDRVSSGIRLPDGEGRLLGGLSLLSGSVDFGFGFNAGYKMQPGLGLYFNYTLIASASGTSTSSTGSATASGSASASSFGFVFGGGGYDYMLGQSFSVGGEANFLLVTNSGAGSDISGLAIAKYWF